VNKDTVGLHLKINAHDSRNNGTFNWSIIISLTGQHSFVNYKHINDYYIMVRTKHGT